MLGMCPTLATTTSAINGLGMGLSTTAVLMFSNLLISALRKIIPDKSPYSGLHRSRSQPGYSRTALNAGLRFRPCMHLWVFISRLSLLTVSSLAVQSHMPARTVRLNLSSMVLVWDLDSLFPLPSSVCAVSSSVQVRSSDTPLFRKLTTFPSSSLHRCSVHSGYAFRDPEQAPSSMRDKRRRTEV